MKNKIVEALKNKYKNLGLSDKALEALANMLVLTTTEEANIETAVNGVEEIAKSFQSEADRIRTEAAKAKTDPSKKDGDANKGGKTEPDQEVPAWAKGLIESNKALTEKLQAFESGKATESRKQILEGKLKDAPKAFKNKVLKDFERMKFEQEEDFTKYVNETEADLAEFNQEIANIGLTGHRPPIMGAGNKTEEVAFVEFMSEINKS